MYITLQLSKYDYVKAKLCVCLPLRHFTTQTDILCVHIIYTRWSQFFSKEWLRSVDVKNMF